MKKKIVGIALICAALLTLGFWEFWGRRNIGYDEILTFKENIPKSGIIDKYMLTTKKVENAAKDALKPGEEAFIIGKESSHYIPKSEALYREYFIDNRLATGGISEDYVLSLPDDWLESYPQTLRRGDDVLFCCKGAVVTKAVVAYARDGNNAEVIFSENERLSGSAPVSNIEVVVSEKQANMLGKLADKGNKFVLLYAAGGDD